jgi:hypothetical protein
MRSGERKKETDEKKGKNRKQLKLGRIRDQERRRKSKRTAKKKEKKKRLRRKRIRNRKESRKDSGTR